MDEIEVRGSIVGPIRTNCYFVKNKNTGQGFLMDPGDEPRHLEREMEAMGLLPDAILLTHGHYDHILAVNEIKTDYPSCQILISEGERRMVNDQSLNSGIGGYDYTITPDRYLRDLEEVVLAGIRVVVYATPGHTEGSACFYLPDYGLLFSGDTVFFESYGRCDLPTGSARELRMSLERILGSLPGNTRVCPGHGNLTTVGHEAEIEGC